MGSRKKIRIKFVLFFILVSIFFLVLSIFNLGKFLDITKEPLFSDVIVILGGGGAYRTEKALELYQKGYSKSDKIIFTATPITYKKLADGSYRKINIMTYLKKKGILPQNIIYFGNVNNTMQELQAVKAYLLKNNMKSALIISDAPHSRRVVLLANSVLGFNGLKLNIRVVSSGAPWWNRNYYYKNKTARNTAILETIKLPYNYIMHGILYDIFVAFGISEFVSNYLSPLIEDKKKLLTNYFYSN